MDGEHAFSAALVLVMVNIAFPYNSRDASSMHAALSVLRGMADKGNDFIKARHSMLVKMTSSNTSQAPPHMTTIGEIGPHSTIGNLSQNHAPASQMAVMDIVGETPTELPQIHNDLPMYPDMPFDFDFDDDPTMWEAVSGNIGVNMDADWLENTLRREPATAPR